MKIERQSFVLPDGSTLEIGPARFRAPEVLFRPDLIGEEYEGLHECLVFAIQRSDMDLRKLLFQNIVLSGGSTLFKAGFISVRTIFVQKRKMFIFSRAHSHALTNATRRHEYFRVLSRLLPVPGVLVSFLELHFLRK